MVLHLFSQSLTAQRICAISSSTDRNSRHSFAKLSAWWAHCVCRVKSVCVSTKTQTAIPCECLLGVCAFGASGYLKILYAIFAIIYIISLPGDCHAYARNDKRVGTPTTERTLIQGVLINGMCLFKVRAARRREKRTPSLTYSTSERTSLDSFRPRTSDIRRER